jgi:predicted nucleic acid-binding protein
MPVAAYAVDATIVAGREAGLQTATAQAAETAAQQLNIGAIRSTGVLKLDSAAVGQVVAQTMVEEEPGARVDSLTVTGTEVTAVTSESVTLPFSVFSQTVSLHAHATGRLVAGYDTPLTKRLETVSRAEALDPLPIDSGVAHAWATLRLALRDKGLRIPLNDSWIAATAIAHHLPVVVQDADYDGVPRLEVIRV